MSDEDLFGREHVKAYIDTNGKRGHAWRGTQTLLLTTTGRRSGQPRIAPLIYAEDDGRYVLVASQGGRPQHPAWYLNLQADPDVEVQVWGERFAARARDAEREERERLWRVMAGEWPAYDDYQARTDRKIPVVILERV